MMKNQYFFLENNHGKTYSRRTPHTHTLYYLLKKHVMPLNFIKKHLMLLNFFATQALKTQSYMQN